MIIEKERPPLITFEVRAVEDRTATIENGIATYKDVDFVILTPIGGNALTVIEREATQWLEDHRRRNTQFIDMFEKAYESWKKGEELPTTGTPIKMWAALTPAQVKQLISGGCRTLEDLASWPDGSLTKLGMGAAGLKQRAIATLSAAKDSGAAGEKIAALEHENKELKDQVKKQADELKRLSDAVAALQPKGKRAA